MYTTVALPPLILTSVDYHIAAAESHEEAAEAHRQAHRWSGLALRLRTLGR